MAGDEIVTLFVGQNCPKCEAVKDTLMGRGIVFFERNMSDPVALTDLRFEGVFPQSAPVLKVGEDYYYDNALFDGSGMKSDVLGLVVGCRQ